MGWDWFYIGNRLQETEPNQTLRKQPTYRHVRQHDVLQLVEQRVGLEGVTVTLEDRVRRQEGAVEGVVVLQRFLTVGWRLSSLVIVVSSVARAVGNNGNRFAVALLHLE